MIKTKEKKDYKKSFAFIMLYFYLVLILLLLLTVATYTWMSLGKEPRVSNMTMHIKAVRGVEISKSPDADQWLRTISYADIVSETSPLRPVTWSEEDGCFYGAVYGVGGRLTGEWTRLTDRVNANSEDNNGYYCVASLYARTDQDIKLTLTPAREIVAGQNGMGTYVVGSPVWNPDKIAHDNCGKGAETAIRIGFMITRLDENNREIPGSSDFIIYEPNCDAHVDGSTGYEDTLSKDGGLLVDPEKHLIQTSTTWKETYPVQRDVQDYEFGSFAGETLLATMDEGEVIKISIYIWLEGQDVDCVNSVEDAMITANIQLEAKPLIDQGLIPIE